MKAMLADEVVDLEKKSRERCALYDAEQRQVRVRKCVAHPVAYLCDLLSLLSLDHLSLRLWRNGK